MSKTVEAVRSKSYDPIRKRLWAGRIYPALLIIFWIAYLIFALRNSGTIFFAIFYSLFGIANAVSQVRTERYWKRIGVRRDEALHDFWPFINNARQPVPNGSALPIPTVIHLRNNRRLMIIIGSLLLIIILAVGGGLTIMGIRQGDYSGVLIFGSIVVGLLLACGVILYFSALRYRMQTIEITEEGIRTRYMRQERFIGWHEARIFATYFVLLGALQKSW